MSQNAFHPRLLSPLKVGRHTLRNRVIMGSMHTRLDFLDRGVEREAAFYAERARGGVAMIVTGGCSPNEEGCLEPGAHRLDSPGQLAQHRPVVAAVHAHGALMLLQILHAGRYAKHDSLVAPSAIRSPINRLTPREMSEDDIERTLSDYVRCAELAREAGYDGVEVMGSEGYLITQFCALRTNARDDCWGGMLENRCRFAVEVVRRIRQSLGPEFLIMFRLSALDLVEGGLDGAETDYLARAIETAGADILSTGIGWHEATIPTISYHVPRAAWRFAVARLKKVVGIPVVASNRINTPALAEEIVASGEADLMALARPMLADAEFVAKAAAGRADEITPCIACNQSCLDNIFSNRAVSCLVNPRAGSELDLPATPASIFRRIAVVGAGAGGLACAITAARRGHRVTLYEAGSEVGGQLNIASRIPDKREFHELLRYFRPQLALLAIDLRLDTTASDELLAAGNFDHIVVATGVVPRKPAIPGLSHPKVASYPEILTGRRIAGQRVAIIGTGGIGFDVADHLLHQGKKSESPDSEAFYTEWGVDTQITAAGGLTQPAPAHAARQITLFQRGTGRPGSGLGLTTGWVPRGRLRKYGVDIVSGCRYEKIDDRGLHYTIGEEARVAEVDTIIICAGQEPVNELAQALSARGIAASLIGGARLAGELDAARAIDEGTRLAYRL